MPKSLARVQPSNEYDICIHFQLHNVNYTKYFYANLTLYRKQGCPEHQDKLIIGNIIGLTYTHTYYVMWLYSSVFFRQTSGSRTRTLEHAKPLKIALQTFSQKASLYLYLAPLYSLISLKHFWSGDRGRKQTRPRSLDKMKTLRLIGMTCDHVIYGA